MRQSWRLDRVTAAEGRERKARLRQLRAMERCVAAGLWIGIPVDDLVAAVHGAVDWEHGRRSAVRGPDTADADSDTFAGILNEAPGLDLPEA